TSLSDAEFARSHGSLKPGTSELLPGHADALKTPAVQQVPSRSKRSKPDTSSGAPASEATVAATTSTAAAPAGSSAASTASPRATAVGGWVPQEGGGGRYTDASTTRIPDAPSKLVLTDTGTGSVQLSWWNNAYNESEFQVERDPAFDGGLPKST